MKKLGPLTLKVKIKHLFQLIIVFGALFGCSDKQEQVVPYVRVNFQVYLDYPEYIALNSVNNAVIYHGVGYNQNGVIIYRHSLDEFTAFDATCPKHIETKTAVKLDDGGSAGSATCPECKTVYYFFNYGYPPKGYPLKQYRVTMAGSNSFIVSN